MHDPTWRSGKNISWHVGSAEFRAKSLFFCVCFFFGSFSIFSPFSFFLFLYIALVFLHLDIFFPIALFPFHPTSCHSPEVLREVLRFTYF